MKRIFLALTISVFTISIHAQENYTPDIRQGAKFRYSVSTGGQEIPLLISVDSVSPGYLKLGWNIEGMGNGGWVMKKNSLDKAVRGWWDEPSAGNDIDIADEQTVLVFSKAQWDAIGKDKKTDYDQQNYSVKTPSDQQKLVLNGKVLNVILLEGQNGSSRIWILNNPQFPAIVKIEGNTMGPDLTLVGIE